MISAEIPLLLSDEKVNTDRRLFGNKHLNSATEAYVVASVEEHGEIRQWVRDRILLSAGLSPMPEIPASEPVILSEKKYHGVIIKGIRIDVLPGLKLTGSLFLPEKISAPLPGILCPHGHWSKGRVHHDKIGGVVMRCFQLARLGFAVFAYDMIGYNDCNDFPHYWEGELKRRGDFYGISTFGMQTLNSMRAVDFICSLPEVDPERIGCTGASGGASQTWFISVLDDRIKVAAPVCMLSSHFQGGCCCEEGPLLRVAGLTSFDVVASLAPRPLFLPSVTGDWTNHNPDYEIPRLKSVYALFGAENAVKNVHFEDCHNYNQRTREHVYAWLVRELQGIDRGEIIPEENIEPPPPELLWHDGKEPLRATEKQITAAFDKLKNFYVPDSLPQKENLSDWQVEYSEILSEMLETTDLPAENVAEQVSANWCFPGGTARGGILRRRMVGDRVVSVRATPEKPVDGKELILRVLDKDYRESFDDLTEKIIKNGNHLRLIELLGSGSTAQQINYAVRNPETTAAAMDDPYFSMRVQDIITTVVFLYEQGTVKIRIIAEKSTVPAALAASVLTGVPLSVNLEGVDDSIWDDPLCYFPLMGHFGGIKSLLLLNIKAGNRFSNPGKWKDLLEKYDAEITSSVTDNL